MERAWHLQTGHCSATAGVYLLGVRQPVLRPERDQGHAWEGRAADVARAGVLCCRLHRPCAHPQVIKCQCKEGAPADSRVQLHIQAIEGGIHWAIHICTHQLQRPAVTGQPEAQVLLDGKAFLVDFMPHR